MRLLDHLVGDGEHTWRNSDAERFRRLEVDRQLELGRLQHRQIGGLLALENAAGVDADLAMRVHNTSPVAHQSTARDELTPMIDRRNRMTRGQCDYLIAPGVEKLITTNHEPANPLSGK